MDQGAGSAHTDFVRSHPSTPAQPVSSARRAYMADLAQVSEAVLAKYDLDNFDQATPSVDAEHVALIREAQRRHGVPAIP